MTVHNHDYDPSCIERKVGKCMVVIDPADVHQVRRLDDLTQQKYLDDPSVPQYATTADLLAAALLDFAKTPKPDEPQGLGAVVEDDGAGLWVRTDPDAPAWTRWDSPLTRVSWDKVFAVRVLSDGVQP